MSKYFIKNTVMKKFLILLVFLLSGCSRQNLIEGAPISYPKPLYHRIPEFLSPCKRKVNLDSIKNKLEKITGRHFQKPYFSYVTKSKGVYFIRYFCPLKHQKVYAGAEVWIKCGKHGNVEIYYRFLPLE